MQHELGTHTVPASFEWNPDQKEINAIMLQVGADPTADAYYDLMAKCLKQLHGVKVRYQAQVQASTPNAAKFANYSLTDAEHVCGEALKAAAERATVEIRRNLVGSVLKGAAYPREIDFGAVPVAVELA